MEILNKTEKNIYLSYVPHGINHNNFKPVDVPAEFKKTIFADAEYDFVLFWSNRNIRRKQPSDVIYSFKLFNQAIGEERARRTALVMHTQAIDENGTNLFVVANDLAPECNIIFSSDKLSTEHLNYLYNVADVTINLADAEGFGLSTAESVMAGTPILVNVTGGLQDQCGFELNGKPLTSEDYIQLGTLSQISDKTGLTWGEWSFPVFSSAHSIVGSVPTPYIYEDRLNLEDVSAELLKVYSLGRNELQRRGLTGRNAFINELGLTADNMCATMINAIETTISNWKPQPSFEIYKIN